MIDGLIMTLGSEWPATDVFFRFFCTTAVVAARTKPIGQPLPVLLLHAVASDPAGGHI